MPKNSPIIVNENPLPASPLAFDANLSEIKNTAQHQLSTLQEREQAMLHIESDIDLLKKRYQVGKSHLSRLTDWFGERTWVIKIGLGVVFITICVIIGAIFGLVAASITAVISTGIYCLAAFLLLNHYKTSEIGNKRFLEDIVDTETKLKKSVESLNGLRDKVNTILITLCAANTELAEDATKFKAQIELLTEQVQTFTQTISQLEESKDLMMTAHKVECENLKITNDGLQQALADIAKTSKVITEESLQLARTDESLNYSNSQLTDIGEKLKQNSRALSSFTENLEAKLSDIAELMAEEKKQRELKKARFSLFYHPIPSEPEIVDEFVLSTNDKIKALQCEREQMSFEFQEKMH